jgi:hypothetical protein
LNGSKDRKLFFDNNEILALVSYVLCATYTLSFLGSPQHYAGFLIMASISIFVLMKKNCHTKIMIIFALGLLFVVPIHYRYISLGKTVFLSQSQLFEFKNKLGLPIYFRTSLEIEDISKSYDDLTKYYQSKGKIYFISKDKIFIEAYKGVNIEPKIFDIFSNFGNARSQEVLTKMRMDLVDFIVLDKIEQRVISRRIVEESKSSIGSHEYNAHLSLLEAIDAMALNLKDQLISCNLRYCIYKL